MEITIDRPAGVPDTPFGNASMIEWLYDQGALRAIQWAEGGFGAVFQDGTDSDVIQAAAVPLVFNAVSPEMTNKVSIESSLRANLIANRTYLAIAAPSASQNTAQIKSLTRQVNRLFRTIFGEYDATD